MDNNRFDDMARGLAGPRSRRGALKALLGGALGGAAAVAGAGGVLAAKPAPKPDCCPTTAPQLCGLACTATQTDANNCGTCGNVCPSGICTNGACVAASSCTDAIKNGTETDVDCGGSCPKCGNGKTCLADADCRSGSCLNHVCTSCKPGSTINCYTGPDGTENVGVCHAGTATCLRDGSGFGTCAGQVLPQPETCNGFDDDCDGVVDNGFDLSSDPTNCGTCGTVCGGANGDTCSNGTCVCIEGYTQCPDACRPLYKDNNNCGACGHVCPSGSTCSNGACV